MEDDQPHYPPGAEPETPPAPEAPAPEGDKAPEADPPAPEAEVDTPKPGDEPTPPSPETPKPEDPPVDPPAPIKKRSIYDDYKDEKGKRKDAEARAAELEAEIARLKAGDPPTEPATPATPPAPSEPKDELEAFAEEHEMDAAGLNRLVEIIQKRIPSAQLTDDERQTLKDLQTFKTNAEAADQRRQEDASIVAEAPAVKKQLDIHDDKELETVMAEVTRLAHTKEFADKEVDYIVYKNREALSKLVSPKKASFEAGGQVPPTEPPAPKDFSKGGVTPQDVAQAMHENRSGSELEIRRPQ